MRKGLLRCVLALILTGFVVSISPGRLAAQDTSLAWLVVKFKLSMIEGKPLIQVMGPFPTSSMCDVMLKIVQEGLGKQGLELTSIACRNDITLIVPDKGTTPSPPPSQAPSETH
jgi:hypothetical protein